MDEIHRDVCGVHHICLFLFYGRGGSQVFRCNDLGAGSGAGIIRLQIHRSIRPLVHRIQVAHLGTCLLGHIQGCFYGQHLTVFQCIVFVGHIAHTPGALHAPKSLSLRNPEGTQQQSFQTGKSKAGVFPGDLLGLEPVGSVLQNDRLQGEVHPCQRIRLYRGFQSIPLRHLGIILGSLGFLRLSQLAAGKHQSQAQTHGNDFLIHHNPPHPNYRQISKYLLHHTANSSKSG